MGFGIVSNVEIAIESANDCGSQDFRTQCGQTSREECLAVMLSSRMILPQAATEHVGLNTPDRILCNVMLYNRGQQALIHAWKSSH